MSSPSNNSPATRHWRDIPQQVKPRAMSKGGRRRLFWSSLRTMVGVVALGLIGWATWAAVHSWQNSSGRVSHAVPATPISEIVLVTDGVLERTWLVDTLALPRGATLMELDLMRLRERLLASGQVRTAVLTRNFPSTLVATLSERAPVVRVNAQAPGDAAPKTLLVARDGVVFSGAGFDPAMIATLPWLDGVRLVRSGSGFASIDGMGAVAELLSKAKFEAEHLYRKWRVVSLERYASDGELVVTADDGLKMRFSVNDDYFRQLARLDLVLDYTNNPARPQAAIDLALGGQVPVTLTPEVVAVRGSKSLSRPSKNPSSKSSREF
ncbi:FtsQ-type POTRA domain-containing protein [Horticoccus luteus]|uniref:FtsQ-type POTRA domain-containing protein n=1 Tax=Horticoccus luteus TaxID=2862869 RepID=A0A8F9TUL7_9BACT|nr:FtsQ-type POTRA domain-containing protein [Horticoccus luteus]QYM78078.1 FtsQ-type POTRA domain-containing protein [Horticoccus luteus]